MPSTALSDRGEWREASERNVWVRAVAAMGDDVLGWIEWMSSPVPNAPRPIARPTAIALAATGRPTTPAAAVADAAALDPRAASLPVASSGAKDPAPLSAVADEADVVAELEIAAPDVMAEPDTDTVGEMDAAAEPEIDDIASCIDRK